MIVTVWLSGENASLAHAELSAVTARLGGSVLDHSVERDPPHRVSLVVPEREAALQLAGQLALAHRSAETWPEGDLPTLERQLAEAGRSQLTAAFRWVSGYSGVRPPELLARLGNAYRAGGGRISLEHPVRRFWIELTPGDRLRVFEEVGVVDRASFSARRTPKLPFQRPVTMPPRLARALVNLAHIGTGDRVVDPFVGTGSLLLEAALVGARTVGVDASATMVRGALENFSHLGQVPEMLRQSDAAEAATEFPPNSFDALVTDPPYGRASGTRGEAPSRLWNRALQAWTERVRPGGRLAVVVPAGAEVPDLNARLECAIPQRVHRSLTREFRVYVR